MHFLVECFLGFKIDQELLIGGADPNTIWLREERLKGSFLAEKNHADGWVIFVDVDDCDGNRMIRQ